MPKPPKGCWAKLAAGNEPKKPGLPKLRAGQQRGVTISPSADIYKEVALDSKTVEILKSVSEREITVPQVLERPHRAARKHLRTRKPDKREGSSRVPFDPFLTDNSG